MKTHSVASSLNTASILQPLFERFRDAMNNEDNVRKPLFFTVQSSKSLFNAFATSFINLYKGWNPRTDPDTKCHPTEVCTVFNTVSLSFGSHCSGLALLPIPMFQSMHSQRNSQFSRFSRVLRSIVALCVLLPSPPFCTTSSAIFSSISLKRKIHF